MMFSYLATIALLCGPQIRGTTGDSGGVHSDDASYIAKYCQRQFIECVQAAQAKHDRDVRKRLEKAGLGGGGGGTSDALSQMQAERDILSKPDFDAEAALAKCVLKK